MGWMKELWLEAYEQLAAEMGDSFPKEGTPEYNTLVMETIPNRGQLLIERLGEQRAEAMKELEQKEN